MVNYKQGKIYKLVDNTNGNIYVGSTCQTTLAQRLSEHVSKYKMHMNGKYNYVTSFEIIKNGNYDIVLLEACSCETKDELHARERHYIESINCVNKYIVGRTKKEYREVYKETNKDHIKEYSKAYTETNKGKIKEYQQVNKEHIKENNKQYYQANKDKINERKRRYYQAKKEAMKLKNELN